MAQLKPKLPRTGKQRDAVLALQASEEVVVHHHSLNANHLAAVAEARTPETRLRRAGPTVA